MAERPNILLIHSDQHRYDCVGAHGLRAIQTPNLDRLAAEGSTFSRAYSTVPICTPARASLATGTWPTTHGCICIPTSEIGRSSIPGLPTIFDSLKLVGYQTGWVGKFHGELPERPGPENGVDDYRNNWGYRAYRESLGIAPVDRSVGGLFGSVDRDCPPEHSSLAWQADQVVAMLADMSGGSAPFFLRWDPPQPHLPCQPTAPFAGLYEATGIPPWSSWPETLEDKPAVLRRQRDIWALHGWEWEHWQPNVRLYYGIISEMDHHIGRVLTALDEAGLADDTLVIYSTDHGDFCGGHGLVDKHFSMYDDITRIPLIVRWPNRVPGGIACDAFASGSIDIARTVVAASGAEVPEGFAGEDLVRLAAEAEYRPRDVGFSQYFGTESGLYSCRMIRDDRYKFVYHPVGSCHELYDLQEDPGELRNRVGDPSLAEVRKRLMARLWEEMDAIGDRLASKWTAVELCGTPGHAQEQGLGPYAGGAEALTD